MMSNENVLKIIDNVEKVIVGTFVKILTSYYITANWIDVETAEIEFSESAELRSLENLKNRVDDMAVRLAYRAAGLEIKESETGRGIPISETPYTVAVDERDRMGYWDFNKRKGDILHDMSGNGNTGVINGAGRVKGRYGRGLNFDGVNDYIDFGNPPELNPTDAISLVAWYRPDSFAGSGNEPIIDKGVGTHIAPWYQYHLGVCGNEYSSDERASFNFYLPISGGTSIMTPKDYWIPGKW